MRELVRKLMKNDWYPEDETPEFSVIEEEDFWNPGGWVDKRSHWDQYDEMPWNG
jgi:hypothetical protein